MLIQETWIDKERNCINGESGKYEPFTEDTGKLIAGANGKNGGKVKVAA